MGVWIETEFERDTYVPVNVTPCVGVWIETQHLIGEAIDIKSHPAWVCGLKRLKRKTTLLNLKVTPCVGVWIETCNIIKTARTYVSHPAWVCGLKPCDNDIHASFVVTPCVGVWIETIFINLVDVMD